MSQRGAESRPTQHDATAERQRSADLHRKIDSAYDKAEVWVSGIGRVLGVDTSGASGVRSEAASSQAPQLSTIVPARAWPAASAGFEIVEIADNSGAAIAWLVTNGHESAKCPSRKIAEGVLDYLTKARTAP